MLDLVVEDVRTLRPSGLAAAPAAQKECKVELRSLKTSAPRKPKPELTSSSATATGMSWRTPSASLGPPSWLAPPRPRTAPKEKRAAVARRRVAEKEEHPLGAGRASAGEKGYLESRTVRPQTRRTHVPILRDFWDFAALLPPISCHEDLGERLVDFCYFEGMPSAYGSKLKAALGDENPRYSRHGAGRLPRFARALQAWIRLSPGKTRPVPWLHLVLIVLDLLHDSLAIEALFFITTFVCYFRPGESLPWRFRLRTW